ncbi:hypothetical protein EKK58_00925 [Candidatus Dependentiae bacterium]|nr:MAG: hypothetical protein EKK58_00925 [Candidatus Dependentiae bacterium]
MKRQLLHLLFILSILIAPLALADGATNKIELISPETRQLVATNANQLMVEILTGVKNEGGKIYAGTKEALGAAYETVKKETPEVIREFMVWRAIHHGVWMGVSVALAGVAFYWSRRFKKMAAECPEPTYTGGVLQDPRRPRQIRVSRTSIRVGCGDVASPAHRGDDQPVSDAEDLRGPEGVHHRIRGEHHPGRNNPQWRTSAMIADRAGGREKSLPPFLASK